ncbi:hypothetical protein Droror1_Dr00001454 [Drosera rotundifolia]
MLMLGLVVQSNPVPSLHFSFCFPCFACSPFSLSPQSNITPHYTHHTRHYDTTLIHHLSSSFKPKNTIPKSKVEAKPMILGVFDVFIMASRVLKPLWVLFILVGLFGSVGFCSDLRNHEVEALMGIKGELDDPNGVLSSWDEFSVDPCSWPLITCSPDNSVVGLEAPSQSLSGTLSVAIGNLTNLREVLLQNNNISGKLPMEIGLLSKLQTLDLSDNRFMGSIPDSLGRLSSLQYMRLNNNSLTGTFPGSLAMFSTLTFLDLSFNNLDGPLPKTLPRTFRCHLSFIFYFLSFGCVAH